MLEPEGMQSALLEDTYITVIRPLSSPSRSERGNLLTQYLFIILNIETVKKKAYIYIYFN